MINIEKHIVKLKFFRVQIKLKNKYYQKYFTTLEEARLFKQRVFEGKEQGKNYFIFKKKIFYCSNKQELI